MTHDAFEVVDDAGHLVLTCLQEGLDDLQQITAETGLENHVVNYRFRRFADLGLLEIEAPDGLVTRVVDGQPRTFRAPKRAVLTDLGHAYFDWYERQTAVEPTHEKSRADLLARIDALETEVATLRNSHDVLKEQLQRLHIGSSHSRIRKPGD